MELSIKDTLNLAVSKHKEGNLKEAEIIYRNILNIQPDNPDALHLLGLIAHQTGNHSEAINLISKAIQLNQNNALYHHNLGMVYDSLGKEEISAELFKKALNLDAKYENAHLAHYNLGVFFKNKGEIERALEHFNKAIELKDDFSDAQWNRGLILLLKGDFKKGWKGYEHRFKKEIPTDPRIFNKPKWDGSQLNNKRILVISEQGFGDNIQFIRYLPLIKERGGYIILECKKELRNLFNSFKEIDNFIDKDMVKDTDFDFYIHLMSLPEIFNTDLSNIPHKTPYLKADQKKSEEFKSKFDNNFFKIGIAWAGNPKQENDWNRTASFEKFELLKQIPGIKLYSLQKGDAAKQLDDKDIIDLSEAINDFSDAAAAIDNLDLIITVDTSIAHLAGAINKKVWTILAFVPDWRWMMDTNESPWYPSMRLFRQHSPGNWDSVFEDVIKELKNLVN